MKVSSESVKVTELVADSRGATRRRARPAILFLLFSLCCVDGVSFCHPFGCVLLLFDCRRSSSFLFEPREKDRTGVREDVLDWNWVGLLMRIEPSACLYCMLVLGDVGWSSSLACIHRLHSGKTNQGSTG